MINNNKILTVSYGTFSCTLEGFDDSFGTMKVIAEYFRDLSADDRYFGAEPAQPDAQMLARIAEREISRHVEAREDKGRIVLSAQSTPQKAAALVASDAVDDVADAIAEAAVAKAQAFEQAPEASAEAAPTKSEASAAEAPAVKVNGSHQPAAQKARIVAKSVLPTANDTAVASVEQKETGKANDQAPEAAPAEPGNVGARASDVVPSVPDEEVEAFFADSASRHAKHDDVEEDATPAQDRAKADSIADKLKRIRAVVSRQAESVAAPDYSEDQHADAAAAPAANSTGSVADEDEVGSSGDVLAETLRDLEDALESDDEVRANDTADENPRAGHGEDDDIAAILNRLESETEKSDLSADYGEGSHLDDDEKESMGGNILDTLDGVDAGPDTGGSALADENLFEAEAPIKTTATAELQEVAAEAEAQAPLPEAPDTKQAPRTRVLKVKRATLEAAIQSGQLEEYDEEEAKETPSPARKTPAYSLSDEAEDALARELAELEADMAGDKAARDHGVDIQDTNKATVADPAVTTRAGNRGSADEDFSRLMDESEHQMEEPEAATRRDAFAHLRAAVAAKKADDAVGGAAESEETDEAYRDDLANVVRPRRPVAGERPRTERPAEARPAPLKLVAEQRIDTGASRSIAPVRPRRVAAVAHSATPQSDLSTEGFADFADEMGATKLPDLLEAAAAYLSFVEGHAQFSRPQLMTKVRQVERENFTREDSLRSFGKLLREGKIEKMKGGRFQASEQIGFKPAKRAAG